MMVYELNIDGLVGPTHHYAGLYAGNIASTSNAMRISKPAAAARQGISKMRLLHELGLKQALMPPHQRPNLHLLYELGFNGTPSQQINSARRSNPNLLSACYSASSMWTANAATVSASMDTQNNRVHFTPANLISNLHRHQEAAFSGKLLQYLFNNENHFEHHPVLPKTMITSDEGAANFNRLCKQHDTKGISLFVYGKQALPAGNSHPAPIRYPARQTLEASQAIARSHKLDPSHVVFAYQNPLAIDLGVFHNDVISVANESVFLLHEEAFLNQKNVLNQLEQKSTFPLNIIQVKANQISITDAVSTYLFNSQLITLPSHKSNKTMALIAPSECENHPQIKSFIDNLLANPDNPIQFAYYLDLKQSMRNGGGPACLRLRVPLTEDELNAMHQGVVVDEALLQTLERWVDKYYRTELQANDLGDPSLLDESFSALEELTSILRLGPIYPFQREITD